MNIPKECPKCKEPWQEKETIYEFFLKKHGEEEKARKSAELYGCTLDKPKHFGKNVVGVEVIGEYDGVSQWKCLCCETHFDRWNMKEIPVKEYK